MARTNNPPKPEIDAETLPQAEVRYKTIYLNEHGGFTNKENAVTVKRVPTRNVKRKKEKLAITEAKTKTASSAADLANPSEVTKTITKTKAYLDAAEQPTAKTEAVIVRHYPKRSEQADPKPDEIKKIKLGELLELRKPQPFPEAKTTPEALHTAKLAKPIKKPKSKPNALTKGDNVPIPVVEASVASSNSFVKSVGSLPLFSGIKIAVGESSEVVSAVEEGNAPDDMKVKANYTESERVKALKAKIDYWNPGKQSGRRKYGLKDEGIKKLGRLLRSARESTDRSKYAHMLPEIGEVDDFDRDMQYRPRRRREHGKQHPNLRLEDVAALTGIARNMIQNLERPPFGRVPSWFVIHALVQNSDYIVYPDGTPYLEAELMHIAMGEELPIPAFHAALELMYNIAFGSSAEDNPNQTRRIPLHKSLIDLAQNQDRNREWESVSPIGGELVNCRYELKNGELIVTTLDTVETVNKKKTRSTSKS